MRGTKTIRTVEEVERAAKLAEGFDPSSVSMDDTSDLCALAEAVDAVRAGEACACELVVRARASGRSWGEVGIALGISPPCGSRALRRADPCVGSPLVTTKLPPPCRTVARLVGAAARG